MWDRTTRDLNDKSHRAKYKLKRYDKIAEFKYDLYKIL